MLNIQTLCVGYEKKVVVSDINLRIEPSQFVALVGPNGSGKTTILKTIARLLSPIKGVVYISGKNIYDMSQKELAKKMAVVLTEKPKPGLLTGFEFVALGRYPYTDIVGRLKKEDREKIDEALELVRATGLSNRYFGELSDGEKQKLILARAIAQDPQVIILDEPALHLDLRNKIEVLSILHTLSKKKRISIVASLHEIDIAFKIADLLVLIKDGKIIDIAPPEKISSEKIIRLYELEGFFFDKSLYSIELKPSFNNKKKVFVIAGAGKGAPLYRFFLKHGFSVITGILHENDIDFYVASSTGARIIREKAFEKIGQESIREALSFLNKADFVIDSGFPIGALNQENIRLIDMALKSKKKLYSLRNPHEAKKYIRDYKNLIYVKDVNIFSSML